jgi:hypothetical protein
MNGRFITDDRQYPYVGEYRSSFFISPCRLRSHQCVSFRHDEQAAIDAPYHSPGVQPPCSIRQTLIGIGKPLHRCQTSNTINLVP